MRNFAIFFLLMAVLSGCVKESDVSGDCVPGDDFNCVSNNSDSGGDTGTTTPPTPDVEDEVCNDGIDNDNDGNIDCADSDCANADNCIDTVDEDGDGYADDVDCDDRDENVNPGATEVCDGVDNNCDGDVDVDAVDVVTYFADNDGDGYGNDDNGTFTACEAPEGFVVSNDDCNDGDANVNPGATEVCDNSVDNDCDGDMGCNDADCDGQVGATLSFEIGSSSTDSTPSGTAYWEDNTQTSEAIALSSSTLPGLSAELVCGEDTFFAFWVLTDSITVTASPTVSIFMNGYTFDQGMDTSLGDWTDHTAYSATPSEYTWFNLYVCIADCEEASSEDTGE